MSVAWIIIALTTAIIAVVFFYNHGKRRTPDNPSATGADGGDVGGGDVSCNDSSGSDGACDGGGGDGGGGDGGGD